MESNDKPNMQAPDELLIIKYLRGKASSAEAQLVETWLSKDVANRKLFEQLQYIELMRDRHEHIISRDTDSAYASMQRKLQKHKRMSVLRQVSIAASVLLGIVSIVYLITAQKSVRSEALARITISSKDYLRKPFKLPDGTIVYLNAGTTLSYTSAYNMKDRKVTLRGQAYFKVAKTPSKPFTVNAADALTIQVLGTSFNVRAYRDHTPLQTTLISGSVALDVPGKAVKTVLTPSQRASYSVVDNSLAINKVDAKQDIDWVHNRLQFRETPMPEVLIRLSHFYNVAFKVSDSVINAYSFTGVFEDKPLSTVLAYMQIASNIKCKVKPADIKTKGKQVIELSR